MADGSGGAPAKTATAEEAAAARAKVLEGVDFIENEEDAEAVESAVVKIQSTFRGKKIRSKLGQKSEPEEKGCGNSSSSSNCKESSKKAEQIAKPDKSQEAQDSKAPQEIMKSDSKPQRKQQEEGELERKVAKMQVNERKGSKDAKSPGGPDDGSQPTKAQEGLAQVDQVERAAAKIQAGFKGYKTRKELEGLLGAGTGARGAASSA